MPELPEVETVLRTLEKQIKGKQILDVEVLYERIVDNVSVEQFKDSLKNQTFKAFKRIGKYLIFELDQVSFVVHLRMEGKFYILQQKEAFDKHIHVVFHLSDKTTLQYHDTRKFGRMYVYPITQPIRSFSALRHVGYDVFDEKLIAMDLYRVSRNKTVTLKQFLLDQSILAGIGNIYANEICFRVSLHPQSRVHKLSKKDFENILRASRDILAAAIQAGGTTIRSYTSSLGIDGRFQLQLYVHNRAGEVCKVCAHHIEKKQVGGRGTYFCRQCQKRK